MVSGRFRRGARVPGAGLSMGARTDVRDPCRWGRAEVLTVPETRLRVPDTKKPRRMTGGAETFWLLE